MTSASPSPAPARSAQAPLVSVCIPTYCGAAFIGATIESVLKQTHSDFELLVVDDNSTDATGDVVAAYVRADPRVRYHRNPRNLGPEGNWNRCVELARGDYFKLLPHDDLLYPSCLSRQVAVLDGDREHRIAIAFCARDVIASDGRVLFKRRGWPGARSGPVTQESVLRACLDHGTNVVGEPGAVLCRTALARQVGGFDATYPYVVDLDYWVRLLDHGLGHYDADALACFRVWPGSWSVAIGGSQSAQFRGFMAMAIGRTGVEPSRMQRLRGELMPRLNNLARVVYYRAFVR